MSKKPSPMDILNSVRNKAKLDDEPFAKSIAIRLKPGKIKFQLLAKDADNLFRPRTQHMIPTLPNNDDKNEKWMVADCKGPGCPVCAAVETFKKSGVVLDDVNAAYNPKYPYKSLRSIFTNSEHYLLCARILADQADDGNYLPKDSEIGSTHLVQFPRMALNALMTAYEDAMENAEDNDTEVPPLFAIFDGEDKASSLTVTCRVSNQPYACNFSFGKETEIAYADIDADKLKLLTEIPEVPAEHYDNCVKRIKKIQQYFVKSAPTVDNDDMNDDDLPFTMNEDSKPESVTKEKTTASADSDDEDFNIDDLL